MNGAIRHCLFCTSTEITAAAADRFVFVVCRSCQAEFCVEFNPPDQPEMRARITSIDPDVELPPLPSFVSSAAYWPTVSAMFRRAVDPPSSNR